MIPVSQLSLVVTMVKLQQGMEEVTLKELLHKFLAFGNLPIP
jgi:hypothetical protein